MKTAAVVIDAWKLPIFQRHLATGGYTYETCFGIAHNTLTLKVSFEAQAALVVIIQNAQAECRHYMRKTQ